ncbi:MAG: trehalose-phosphatase [Planctomycetes bacterium]|nr:trehalose-phosphatase [Planctomycetota bacterium]MCC7171448.1 trehalose-phosphatase [Planctomycetota bacterium]
MNASSRFGRARIRDFVRSGAVLAFDFDGTLAPIRRDPDHVHLSARMRAALTRLTARAPCVVLSGRARVDLELRVRGLGLVALSGDHGHDRKAPSVRERATLDRYAEALVPIVTALRGTRLERKRHTLAVHWRTATSPALARRHILRAVRALAPARSVFGKCVVELHADATDHKGTALERLCRSLRRTRALYVGDDTTDEDVFTRPGRIDVLGIHVGRGPTRAALRLDRQAEVVELIEFLGDALDGVDPRELKSPRCPTRAGTPRGTRAAVRASPDARDAAAGVPDRRARGTP